jgi:uncharacterized protein
MAVSGGIDSTLLMYIAATTVANVRAVHAVSPAVPTAATSRVRDFAERYAWDYAEVGAGEFSNPQYVENPVNRCFFCKSLLYSRIRELGEGHICSGANLDDLGDYRPGLLAAESFSVIHPYIECGISKRDIRTMARGFGFLELARLPASPCLASRIETHQPVEAATVRNIDEAETYIRGYLDLRIVRCRYRAHGIEIEIGTEELKKLDSSSVAELKHYVETIFQRPFLGIGKYSMGSAFLHESETVEDA